MSSSNNANAISRNTRVAACAFASPTIRGPHVAGTAGIRCRNTVSK